MIKSILTGKSVVTRGMELRLRGSDEVQFIDFVYEPIRDEKGEVTGIFVGGYEVTEVHRTAAALRTSEARLRELNADLERQVIERTQARGRTWQVSPDLIGRAQFKGLFRDVQSGLEELARMVGGGDRQHVDLRIAPSRRRRAYA